MHRFIKKTPDGFLVMARDPWEIFMDGVRQLSDAFMAERQQPKLETRQP